MPSPSADAVRKFTQKARHVRSSSAVSATSLRLQNSLDPGSSSTQKVHRIRSSSVVSAASIRLQNSADPRSSGTPKFHHVRSSSAASSTSIRPYNSPDPESSSDTDAERETHDHPSNSHLGHQRAPRQTVPHRGHHNTTRTSTPGHSARPSISRRQINQELEV